jgi:hypothetical protein
MFERHKSGPFLTSLDNQKAFSSFLIIAVLTLAIFLLALVNNNNSLKQEINQIKLDTKRVEVPFDYKKGYVNSTLIYQQINGTVTNFDKESLLLTLEREGEQFSLKIPLGPEAGSFNPPPYADLSGMYQFKVGDKVKISGGYAPGEEFQINQFVIVKD